MALPLPEGKKIHITHNIKGSDYQMPSMEAASDHYTIGYIISGDRRTITPAMSYTQHAGYINALAPFVYHKTMPASDAPYENILIKFSPEIVKPLTNRFGMPFLDQIYAHPSKHFDEETSEKIGHIIWDMYYEYESESNYSEFKLQCMLMQLLIIIHEKAIKDKDVNIHNQPLSESIIEAVYYMENHYAENIHIEEVAKLTGYSTGYFSRQFSSQMGCSFSDYLGNIRLKHVQNMLLTTDKSITDIALENGYEYSSNMSAAFTRHFGMTPKQFRKMRQ